MKYLFLFVLSLSVAYFKVKDPLWKFVTRGGPKNCSEIYHNHSKWYQVNRRFLPRRYDDVFLESEQDEETTWFLESSCEKTTHTTREFIHLILKAILGTFINRTSLIGWLQRGSMFVFSTQQFRDMLGVDSNWTADSLLDLGAGDGGVTQKMADHFKDVYVTEASQSMVWRLQDRGYSVLGIDEWTQTDQKYDIISCLNLLDRCERPLQVLKDIRRSLHPIHGRVILALVLPFKPFVEFGGINNQPLERLDIRGRTFEEQVLSLIVKVFKPAGFQVERFTKLPYLCDGDLYRPYSKLTDAVFVLRPT